MAKYQGTLENLEVGNMLDFFKNKKILITGHTGFKGAWLTRILILAGADIVGYALSPETEPNLFDMLDIEDNIKHIVGDVRDLDKLRSVFGEFKPELVIHLAAQPIVRESYDRPVYTYETNVMGTVNICECVRLSDSVKSFLNVTTDKVYDNKEWEKGYTEDDYLDGFDPYSNSKSCSELVTHSYKRSFLEARNIAVSTARAGNVIGGGDFAKDRIIPDCVRAALCGKEVSIRNPKSVRPFQHVLEPLKVYLSILQKQYEDSASYSGSFNVGPDISDCISTLEIVDLFKKFWGDEFNYSIKEERGPHEAGFLKLDCAKLKKVYAWEPIYDIKEAVAKTVTWSKAYMNGEDMTCVTDAQIKEFFER